VMIRTTFQSMTTGAQMRLMARSAAMEASSARLSSGKQYARPSDNTTAFASATMLRGELSAAESYKSAGEDAQSKLNASDSQLQAVSDRLMRVKELTIQAANATSTPAIRTSIREEVLQIRDELVGIANAKYQGQPLFAGFSSGNAVTPVAGGWSFTGAPTDRIIRSISASDTVQLNVVASEVFTNGTTDTFTMLDKLATDLASGNNAGITGAITTLDQTSDVVSSAQARIGAATGLVERALARNSSQQITLHSDLANVEDIDLTEAVTDLNRQQAAYQAALGATSKSIQQSLVDWLR